jgi:predicted DNA-binding protein with PD1-like motif
VNATLGYFDWDKKDYERIPMKARVEVLALVGDIALQDGRPKLHAHVVLGRRAPEAQARAGERPRADRYSGLSRP